MKNLKIIILGLLLALNFGCDPEDIEVIKSGPMNLEYWDAWDTITNNFETKEHEYIHENDGDIWILGADEDFWEIPDYR